MSIGSDVVFLVWIQTAKGPQPQKWHSECFDVRPCQLVHVLHSRPLEEFEADLSLDDLARRYPPP
jgi:hypothetical protein